MTNKEDNRDKHIKYNCIISGIVFITIGAVLLFAVLAGAIKTEKSSLWGIVLLSALSIIVGVIQMLRPSVNQKNKDAEKEYGTEQNKRYLRRKDKELIKRKAKDKKHKDIYSEMYWLRMKSMGLVEIISLFCAVLVYIAGEETLAYFLLAFCFLTLIYNLIGFSVIKLRKSAADSGLDYVDLNNDFMFGALYTSFNSMINIGQKYTVYVCELNSIIIQNDKIQCVIPASHDTEIYQNGVYTGKATNYYVEIVTIDGKRYKLNCAEFQDKMIIDEYRKISSDISL